MNGVVFICNGNEVHMLEFIYYIKNLFCCSWYSVCST